MYLDTLKFSLSFLIFSLASRFFAGLRPAASHSVRSTRPEPGRPWTTSPSPWTAGTACGCTLAAHRLGRVAHRRPTTGGTPPEPPAVHPHGPRFEFLQKPENRQGLGVGHGQPQAVAHPRHRRTRARNPLRLGDRGSRGPVREGAPGGAAQGGRGACRPTPRSALGAGGTPGGLSLFGPLGGA